VGGAVREDEAFGIAKEDDRVEETKNGKYKRLTIGCPLKLDGITPSPREPKIASQVLGTGSDSSTVIRSHVVNERRRS